MTSIPACLLTMLLGLVLAGCGAATSAGRPGPGPWERLPDPPLSAREAALGLSVGREVLVLGGSDAKPCPPSADCAAATGPPLRDGAAFDPEQRTWRRIAPAPVGFSFAEGVVVGASAYVLAHGEPGRPQAPRAFLRYRIDDDRWEELPFPPGDQERSIAATGEALVAFTTSDERGEGPDLVFDPATDEWSELPDDPLPRSFDRTVAWSGRELALFAHELVPQPGATEPSLVIAAALDVDSRTWRRLPDSEILGQGARWFATGGRLILPALGGADGGEVGNWGRPYPYGGILDPERGRWSDLPRPPTSSGEELAAGVVSDAGADYFGSSGWILDATAEDWIEIPPLDDYEPRITGRVVAAAGEDMVVFGGVRWSRGGGDGRLVREAWIWSPRG